MQVYHAFYTIDFVSENFIAHQKTSDKTQFVDFVCVEIIVLCLCELLSFKSSDLVSKVFQEYEKNIQIMTSYCFFS